MPASGAAPQTRHRRAPLATSTRYSVPIRSEGGSLPPTGAMTPSAPSNALQTILVATDGSPASADAVAMAVDLAVEHRSHLVIVHVAPLVDTTSPLTAEAPPCSIPHQP